MQSAGADQRHGQIACGTIAVADLDSAIARYRDFLHHAVVEIDVVGPALANAWDAVNAQDARYAVLQPAGNAPSFLRLVETPASAGYVPARSCGWNAFEISVKDVFALAKELDRSDFTIVGPPKLVDGFTSFIPMQVFGPDGEVLFLNQVNHSEEDADLPKSAGPVGQIFIVVVASPDREATVNDYVRCLDLDRAATHSLRYGLVNRAFELPADTLQTITMVQNQRTPFAQVDQYPGNADQRAQQSGCLPAGNAMVSVLVDSLDRLPLAERTVGPVNRPAAWPYRGRKTQVIRGAASELIELIEIGDGAIDE